VTWLYEDPITILVVGAVLCAVLAVVFSQVSRLAMVAAVLVALLATGGMLLIERRVVTDMEKVENTLYGAAEALENEDLPRLITYIAPRSKHLVTRADLQVSRWDIREVKIANLKIEINRLTTPPSARAEFLGRAEVVNVFGGGDRFNYVGRIELTFRREKDRYFIDGYKELR